MDNFDSLIKKLKSYIVANLNSKESYMLYVRLNQAQKNNDINLIFCAMHDTLINRVKALYLDLKHDELHLVTCLAMLDQCIGNIEYLDLFNTSMSKVQLCYRGEYIKACAQDIYRFLFEYQNWRELNEFAYFDALHLIDTLIVEVSYD